MALHWRTLIYEPAADALARAGWDQSGWNPEFGKENPLPPPSTFPMDKVVKAGGYVARGPEGSKYIGSPVSLRGEPGGDHRPHALPVDDLYADWALACFGREVAKEAASIFIELDTFIPLPDRWGSRGLKPDSRPWNFVSKEFAFVDRFEKLRSRVKGAGNRERFDFWCNQFLYTRATAHARCKWAEYLAVEEQHTQEKDPAKQRELVVQKVVPAHMALLAAVEEAYGFLLATVTDIGGMQTVLNWEGLQNLLSLEKSAKWLKDYLGDNLKEDVFPSKSYKGDPRIIVPTVRTLLEKGEPLRLKVIVLDNQPASSVQLHWRPIGEKAFRSAKIQHVARAVYNIKLPSPGTDFEYYIEAKMADGKMCSWPATAPEQYQTVVVMPSL